MNIALEEQLILECVQVRMTGEGITSATRLIQQALDWNYILQVSIRHAVSPLLYNGLNQVFGAEGTELDLQCLVPDNVMARLRALYNHASARNTRLYRVAANVCEAFQRSGVPVMGLKDLHLAREVYPDIGLRPMGDIDLLIHRQDYTEAANCLVRLGFRPQPDADIPFLLKYALGHNFMRSTDNSWVDLQWGMMQRQWDRFHEGSFNFETERMWRGARAVDIGGSRMLVPSPEDMLYHLCLHLEGHEYSELILFCDILEMLRYYGSTLDWERVVALARKQKSEYSIFYVLLLVERLFRAQVPSAVLEELSPDYFKAYLFGPLSSNLGRLHYLLDEIRLATRPPKQVMRKYETVARAQAAGAMQLYKVLDGVISDFLKGGGKLVIPRGESSERILPALELKPFGDVSLLILDDDLPAMQLALLGRGFTSASSPGSLTLARSWRFTSIDPALAGKPVSLNISVDIATGAIPPRLCRAVRASNSEIALKLLRSRPKGHHYSLVMPLQVSIVALPPEDLLLCLGAWLDSQDANILFHSCALLEFFGHYHGNLHPQFVKELARRHDRLAHLASGLALARGLPGENQQQLPRVARDLDARANGPLRLFEWARHGPAAVRRHPGVKNSFYYLLNLRSLGSNRARLAYLGRSLLGASSTPPVLPGLILGLLGALTSLRRGRRATPNDFAYWTEPEVAPELIDNNRQAHMAHRVNDGGERPSLEQEFSCYLECTAQKSVALAGESRD